MPPNEFRLLGNAPQSNAPLTPRFLITHLALPLGAAQRKLPESQDTVHRLSSR